MESDRKTLRVVRRAAEGPPLGRLLGQVDRELARQTEVEVLVDHRLSIDQWRVLDILADGNGRPMSELAAAIVVPGATLTKIVDRLVDAALVYRLVDDRDRRRVLAFISDKGREVHHDVAAKVEAIEVDVVTRLGRDGPLLLDLLASLAQGPVTEDSRG
ncbi:MarR family transcriptional regulator [Pseudonocardia sp. C8]|uniref:MarR family winged helix-turn-helix transcriptional regulator n=1 Tax=Pseudonocardia sp. C8 TaxID=2762759 RepID=UPI001642A9F7|nr:MarR family transcriptional regulator [Pseudonocardia sp. C8]MBC3194916.1 MarR family transcriptional regulator [Pseudonocardia sp. C8]